ncbi:hypothetical protein FOA52_008593 [Chlamydomonas sp. UWO 241]|nr:hypothetical protein FOA52_008593 [Chlamydomonas sp. UWO 241]
MADTTNAFAMLMNTGENAGAAASAHKKKRKPAKKTEQGAAVAAAPASNGSAAHAPNHSAPAPAARAAAPPAPPVVSGPVDAGEGAAILERAAREAKTIEQKTKLWKEWIRQSNTGKLKYKAADGELDFSQMLLRSNALEITIEGCLVSGLSHQHHEHLSSMLSCLLPGASSQALASALVRLSVLVADEAPDTLGAAQRAARSVITALKNKSGDHAVASGEESWVDRVEGAEKGIMKQQGMLQKMAASSGGIVSKEQLVCAKAIYKMSGDKFDMLLQTPSSRSGGDGAADKVIAELKAVIGGHLREAAALEDGANVKAISAEAQRVQALSAYRREESLVTAEVAEVAAQVRTLEAQLRALKSRQAELEDKRAQLQQRSRKVVDSMGGRGGALHGAAHFRDQASAVDALASALSPGAGVSAEQVAGMRAAQANAPLEYLSAGHQYLSLALAVLSEMPTKLNFCKQRLSHADKLAKLVAGGAGSKQKDEVEKLLADHLRTADDVRRSAMAVVSELNARYEVVVAASPAGAGAAADALHAVDAMSVQIRAAHDGVLAAHAAPLVEAPHVPSANGSHRGGGGGRGPRPASASTPAPAAVPAALAAVVAAAPEPVPVAAPEPVPVAAPAAPTAPRPAARTWGVVTPAAPVADADEGEDALPTPAEAFTKAPAPVVNPDGFTAAPVKKKQRAPKA